MNQQETAAAIINIIIAGEQETVDQVRTTLGAGIFKQGREMVCRTGSMGGTQKIERIFNAVMACKC